MNQNNKMRIYAYLSPHPIEEDLETEVDWLEWIPGFRTEQTADEEEDNPVFFEDNIELYDSIENKVVEKMTLAFENIGHLFRDFQIQEIGISIDIFGLMSTKNSLAGYFPVSSKPYAGYYAFQLDSLMLQKYLFQSAEEIATNPRSNFVWEHELLHMLDHRLLEKASIYKSSDEINELYKHFILKFREEGFAELYYFLHGNYDDITSIEQAKTSFLDLDSEVKRQMEETGLFTKEVYSQYGYYELGPWLLMDCLYGFEGGFHKDIIGDALQKVFRKEALSKEEIFEIIKIALRVGIKDFLDYSKRIQLLKN
jgi:hypothetical protein